MSVVNEAGRTLEVVASVAKGTRRGVGANLPIGKGPGTKSDIDYMVPHSSMDYFKGLQHKLQGLGTKPAMGGVIPGGKFIYRTKYSIYTNGKPVSIPASGG